MLPASKMSKSQLISPPMLITPIIVALLPALTYLINVGPNQGLSKIIGKLLTEMRTESKSILSFSFIAENHWSTLLSRYIFSNV